jgi:hypothetical protein
VFAVIFTNHATDVRAAIPVLRDASPLLERLLNGGHTVVAGRLAGAFRSIGRMQIADEFLKTMAAAGYHTRENDPLMTSPCSPSPHGKSRLRSSNA